MAGHPILDGLGRLAGRDVELAEVVDVEPAGPAVLFEELPLVEPLEGRIRAFLEDRGLMDGSWVGDVSEEQGGQPGASLGGGQTEELGMAQRAPQDADEAIPGPFVHHG